eukprot:6189260-Pleurochrysis_carterae.AAC.6
MPIWARPKSVTCGSTGSATDSDHNLDAPNVCTLLPNVRHHVGQIKGTGSEIKLFLDCLAMRQRSSVLRATHPSGWLGEDVHCVVLALNVLGLDGAVGDQLADLELAAVDVVWLGLADR